VLTEAAAALLPANSLAFNFSSNFSTFSKNQYFDFLTIINDFVFVMFVI